MKCVTLNIQIYLRGDFMNKIKKTTLLLATLAVMVSAPVGSMITSNAATPAEEHTNISTMDSTTPGRPTVDYVQYNTMVTYNWNAGVNADRLAIGRVYFDLLETSNYFDVTPAQNIYGTKVCDPSDHRAMSYSTPLDLYSEETTLEHIVGMGDYSVVRYGYDCKYAPTGEFPTSWAVGTTIPTSYDQNLFIASHNGNVGNVIRATICYQKTYIADIEVKIPLLGYKTSSVTLNGVKFDLRTGPFKVSIRASQSGISVADVKFMYAV